MKAAGVPGEVTEVVAAVIERDGKILLTRRREGTHLAGLWEFPGGKRRFDEDATEALRREIREELGAELVVGEEIERLDWAYPEKRVKLAFYRCALIGEACPLEGQEMIWVPRADLDRYELPAADAVLVERLRRG